MPTGSYLARREIYKNGHLDESTGDRPSPQGIQPETDLRDKSNQKKEPAAVAIKHEHGHDLVPTMPPDDSSV
jgi:hypothetical protein